MSCEHIKMLEKCQETWLIFEFLGSNMMTRGDHKPYCRNNNMQKIIELT